MTEKEQKDGYATVRIPQEFATEMDKMIGKRGFTSRAEIVKEAVRELLNKYEKMLPAVPRFEHFNINSDGVRILDRSLATKTSNGRVIDIYFKPHGIFCDYDQTDDCEHIRFALNVPAIRVVIRKHQKEGWKIELPEE